MNKRFIIKLSVLVLPFCILTLVLHDGQSGDSIGGGGYDLSGLVYGFRNGKKNYRITSSLNQ